MADATKAYTVLTNVKHDGTQYAQGEKVSLTAKQAKPLLANGAVTDKKVPAKVADDTDQTTE